MSTRLLGFVLSVAILAAAALSAGSAAAGGPLLPPEGFVEIAEPASGSADVAETEPGVSGEDEVQGPAAATAVPDADAESRPASRLLRSLEEWAGPATGASPSPTPDPASTGGGQTAAGAPISGVPGSFPVPRSSPVLHGCPRALLGALLASAADADDAVSALAIERETLALCRERQEIVNGIVSLEGELQDLLAEAQGGAAETGSGAGTAGAADVPVVKVSAPVRVIEMPTPPPVRAEAADPEDSATPPAPQPPAYSWFSILGTAGDLRAGVNDRARVWFVREGDRLPGGVTVTRIVARPPGVHVDGAVEAALPYGPRPADGGGPRGDAKGDSK